jgi:hypothetical protein
VQEGEERLAWLEADDGRAVRGGNVVVLADDAAGVRIPGRRLGELGRVRGGVVQPGSGIQQITTPATSASAMIVNRDRSSSRCSSMLISRSFGACPFSSGGVVIGASSVVLVRLMSQSGAPPARSKP